MSCVSGYCLPTNTGTGGNDTVDQGSLGGSCYPNSTCDANLTCLAGYCVQSSGTGGVGAGGSGQAGSSPGGSAQGGSAQGGSTQGGAGRAGSTQGGSAQGGSAQGGSTQGGSSGTPSTAIVSVDGWIGAGTNTVGIVGPWFAYIDTFSTINVLPAGGTDFTGAGNKICVSGTVSQSDVYGPTIGFNLNQPDAGAAAGWVPSAHGVTGFSFGISGNLPPSALQISYNTVGDVAQYCQVIQQPSASLTTVSISATRFECWAGGGAAALTSTAYQSLQFQLPVNYFANGQAFNFCLTNLKAITG